MSNARIAQRLLKVIARVEGGECPLHELDVAVMAAIGAFEGLPTNEARRIVELPAEAIRQDVTAIEAGGLGIKHSDEALMELKVILNGIAKT